MRHLPPPFDAWIIVPGGTRGHFFGQGPRSRAPGSGGGPPPPPLDGQSPGGEARQVRAPLAALVPRRDPAAGAIARPRDRAAASPGPDAVRAAVDGAAALEEPLA